MRTPGVRGTGGRGGRTRQSVEGVVERSGRFPVRRITSYLLGSDGPKSKTGTGNGLTHWDPRNGSEGRKTEGVDI